MEYRNESKITLMLKNDAELAVGKLLYLGVPAVTLLVTGFANYDPVNVPKMFLLSGIGFGCLFLLLKSGWENIFTRNKPVFILWILFTLGGLISLAKSQAPLVQNFYGTFGRNTGFLTYFSLSLLMLAAANISKSIIFDKLVMGLIFSGVINVILCLLELMGINLFGFNNIYHHILGTFGNPNFISSFLGIFISSYLVLIFKKNISVYYRISALVLLPLAFYEIVTSKSIQGIFVTGIGIGIAGFFLVKEFLKKTYFQIIYLTLTASVGLTAVLGALQIGPLAKLIYKVSITLRGEYWKAGLTMGSSDLLGGVGFDTYGDWYRRARSASAMILPGPTTVSNSAHNVNIEIFASGGLTLLIPYVALIIYTAYLSVRTIISIKSYNATYFIIFTAWICYQSQAIISINQIGVAIWGWVLTGALIGYSRFLLASDQSVVLNQSRSSKSGTVSRDASVTLFSSLGVAVGLAIAFPAYYADVEWRSALKSSSVEKAQAAAVRWPLDSYRLANAALVFEQNKFPQQAYEMAKLGIEHNPYYFDAWKVMTTLTLSTPAEKELAVSKMHELDPRNKKLE
jgi:hypothetical protein